VSTTQRIQALGIVLPNVEPPRANYVAWRRSGDLLYVAGQVPFVDGELTATGAVGVELSLEQGAEQARIAALNSIAVATQAAPLDQLAVVQVLVFVTSARGFFDQHLVANGASDLLNEVFLHRGEHTRTSVAVPALPLNAPVEVQVLFEVRP
jgi:enamine deaminase RidA (YjgF/YER057c/UK114 family)